MLNIGPPLLDSQMQILFKSLLKVGTIFPFYCRVEKLHPFFYFCNGERWLPESPQGVALLGLDDDFKEDWGIAIDEDGLVPLPNFFDANCNGYFPRPVDGVSRLPGSVQEDAIVNIVGSNGVYSMVIKNNTNFFMTGPYNKRLTNEYNYAFTTAPANYSDFCVVDFDASLQVNTATEVRPKNIGFTPAIFLNV